MITKSQINEAQSKWGNYVVEIGALKNNKEVLFKIHLIGHIPRCFG